MRVADAAAARDWLRAAPVTTADWQETPPETALQVALTADGLRALGVEETLLSQFPQPFVAGMAGEESRSRRLGDVGPNAPGRWAWGREAPHVLVLLYATPDALDAFMAEVLDDTFRRGFETAHELPRGRNRGREPFGFADGISEPNIDWTQDHTTDLHRRLTYANLVAPGEFVLGYPNEYQEITPRPLLDAGAPGADALGGRPMRRNAATWGSTAATSCCGNSARMCAASGSSSTARPTATPIGDMRSPRRWWAGTWMARR